MSTGLLLVVGILIGVVAMRIAVMRGLYRGGRPHHHDEHYRAARRVVLRHLAVHGTLNVAQLERLTDTPNAVAVRYLALLERDGLIRMHGHRQGTGAFYTRS